MSVWGWTTSSNRLIRYITHNWTHSACFLTFRLFLCIVVNVIFKTNQGCLCVRKHYLNESILHPQLPEKQGSGRQRGGRARPSRLLRGGGFFHVFSCPRRWKQLPRGGYGQRRWRQSAIGATQSSCTARWDCVYFCWKHVTVIDDFLGSLDQNPNDTSRVGKYILRWIFMLI